MNDPAVPAGGELTRAFCVPKPAGLWVVDAVFASRSVATLKKSFGLFASAICLKRVNFTHDA
jgi:hypothetical protein